MNAWFLETPSILKVASLSVVLALLPRWAVSYFALFLSASSMSLDAFRVGVGGRRLRWKVGGSQLVKCAASVGARLLLFG